MSHGNHTESCELQTLRGRKYHLLLFHQSALEIRTVLQYSRIAKRINEQNRQAYLFFEQHIALFFPVVNDVIICRDKKDNFYCRLPGMPTPILITRERFAGIAAIWKNTNCIATGVYENRQEVVYFGL